LAGDQQLAGALMARDPARLLTFLDVFAGLNWTSGEVLRADAPGRRARPLPALAAIAVGILAACTTPPIPGARPDLLAFLTDGRTTRETVILTLGQPSGSFEQERILTYRGGHDQNQGYYIVSPSQLMPWQNAHYSLVLVFDGDGVLQKHKMVDVR
jgi:hypothetical protein